MREIGVQTGEANVNESAMGLREESVVVFNAQNSRREHNNDNKPCVEIRIYDGNDDLNFL